MLDLIPAHPHLNNLRLFAGTSHEQSLWSFTCFHGISWGWTVDWRVSCHCWHELLRSENQEPMTRWWTLSHTNHFLSTPHSQSQPMTTPHLEFVCCWYLNYGVTFLRYQQNQHFITADWYSDTDLANHTSCDQQWLLSSRMIDQEFLLKYDSNR